MMQTLIVGNVFPARAGVIPAAATSSSSRQRFPRTRGGDPFGILIAALLAAFSPHARG